MVQPRCGPRSPVGKSVGLTAGCQTPQGTPGSSGGIPNALWTAVNGKGPHKAHFSKNDRQRPAFQYLDEPWIFTHCRLINDKYRDPKAYNIFKVCTVYQFS